MISYLNDYELSQYENIATLNDKKEIYIVKDKRDDSIWVKKKIDLRCINVHNLMEGIACSEIAFIKKILTFENYAIVIEEYVNGITLNQYIKNKGALDSDEVKRIVYQLCDGLEVLHKRGIVHRDLTGENILVCVDGSIKIIDLGISRLMDTSASKDTNTLGTVVYAPPEQYGFGPTEFSSDIYSIGILMNYMLTGTLSNRCEYKGNLSFVIKKCLNIYVGERYKSVSQLKYTLNSISVSKYRLPALPGFRSRHIWKLIVSLMLYCLFLLMLTGSVIAVVMCGFTSDIVIGISFFIFVIMIPFLLAADYGYYVEKLFSPKTNLAKNLLCVSFSLIYFIFIICIYFMLLA